MGGDGGAAEAGGGVAACDFDLPHLENTGHIMAKVFGEYCPRTMSPALHQKGANGIVAEYACVLALTRTLRSDGLTVVADADAQAKDHAAAIERVAGELTPEQIARANAQGDALAQHIVEGMTADPGRLGLAQFTPAQLLGGPITVQAVGHQTNSGNSADIVLGFDVAGQRIELPISLKAYGQRPTSLGSKGARASLTRMFLNAKRVKDADFVASFGEPASNFLALLADFKAASKEFYASEAGRAFVAEYRERKGNPTAKVNNPLRRTEVKQYFEATRGFTPQHRFAELYVAMFDEGLASLVDADIARWQEYLSGLRFVLGLDDDILILNAVASEDGQILDVQNSFLSDTYAKLRAVLVPGCQTVLTNKAGSSVVDVRLSYQDIAVTDLSLAVWMDATIQFKLDGAGNA